ncbi:MAG TPA: ABC transporter permease [Clostridia bacterium]|nr:ABC transporter permease [Clostridia bacterium]
MQKINSLRYFFRESLKSIKRNGLLSLASITTVAGSLLILGIFLLLVLNVNHMASSLESDVEITVFLKDDLDEANIQNIGQQLVLMPNVAEVKYVSKEEALNRLREKFEEQKQLLDIVQENNPLPNSYELKATQPEYVAEVAQAAGKINGVDKVKYGQEIVDRLFNLTHMVRIFSLVLILALAVIAVSIIANIIRTTVFNRRKEIGIMKLVGATDWFIRWPFIIEGVILGTTGAILSVIVLSIAYQALVRNVYTTLPFLPILAPQPVLIKLSFLLIASGICLGALGSGISMRKFLRI